MKFAYADPPYPGCAHLYPENTEVDHAELIDRLSREYDGWALSTSSVALKDVLALCPPDVRIAAWVKPFAVFRPNVNPAYAWEPVVFRGARKRARFDPTVRDWHAANITLKKGLAGVKPMEFNEWIINLLGVRPEDSLDDIYPGSHGMARAFDAARGEVKP